MCKQNNCIFRATKKVSELLGVNDLPSDVFDKYNDGLGIYSFLMPKVINEAVNPFGLTISRILCNSIKGYKTIDDVKNNVPNFSCPEKLCFSGAIDDYAIVLLKNEDHVEAFTGIEHFGSIKMAIFLEKI